MTSSHSNADRVIVDATVITLDKADTIANAIALKGEKIQAVGDSNTIESLIGPNTVVHRLNGKAVLPGFIDSHCHMFYGGFAETSLNLSDARSIPDILQMVGAQARRAAEKEWVLGYGYSLQQLSEQRHPTRWELDTVAPNNPVWIMPDSFHSSTTNSIGFDLIKASEFAVEAEDGGANGHRFDGVFPTDETHATARRRVFNFLSDADIAEKIRAVDDVAVSRGVTTIHACEGGRIDQDRDMQVLLDIRDTLKVRAVPYYETFDVDRVLGLGLGQIGGCSRLNLDGMPDNHTAALLEPYSDRPDTAGFLNVSQDVLEDFVATAHRRGLQVAAHAMGDRAIEQLLTAYEKAQSAHPRSDARHRIEHFHLPTDEQVERAKSLGLVVTMQPVFSEIWGGRPSIFETRFGAERYARIDRFKELMEKGLTVCTGADSPAASIDPMRDLALMVDNIVDPAQSLSFPDAARTLTINAAYAAFEENDKGTIEAGKLADLVVLDRVPLDCSANDIRRIGADMTIVGGDVVFEKH